MVDDFGRTWSRGVGSSRKAAIAEARINQPPINIRRSILLSAKHHPMRAALLTATAYHTYKAINAMKNEDNPPSFLALGLFTVVAYIGIRILTHFVHDEDDH
jgi:hypothetical protein